MIDLRPYQHEAVALVRAAMRDGGKRVVLVLPTGAGKTRTGSAIVERAIAKGRRVMWLAHRTELIEQTAKTLHGFGLPVGVVAASSAWPIDASAPVQVCSIQTLLARAHRPRADLLVWDECHHASEAAPAWAALLAAYPDVRAIGLTATPERGDGSGLGPLFDRLVVGTTVRALTEDGHLVPCEVIRPAKLLKPGVLAQEPLAAYQAHSPGQQGFLFAKSVEEAQRYAAEFTAAGIRAVCIHAGTRPEDRAVAIELFKQGVIRILSNVYIFTEGTDLPMASVCILARGASTAGIYLQMVGRVLRPHRGKRGATLIDLRGVTHVHMMPEDERHYSLSGKGIALSEVAKCKVCSQALGPSGYPCACGYAPQAGEETPGSSEVTNEPLVRFARMIAQGPTQRFETLVRWLCAADAKGHKRTSVRHKWRAVYGSAPDAAAWASACVEADRAAVAA
ncbi:MAG TPA: DEAD/DEAH box helicase [Gemmatimonadaceae bacterium]|nr:DEAD/DEAH box helicase [Gemmatimonadaceae bacterium]